MKSTAQVSVIIPSYNQPNTIKSCVDSLLAQDFDKEYEIIIVDSSSKEYQSQIEEIGKLDEKVKLIIRSQQTFPGEARNIGIKSAEADIIALIDSDCIADKDWINNIYQGMEDNLIIAGVFKNGTPKSVFGTCYYLTTLSHSFPFHGADRAVSAAASGNLACKKEVFEKVGYFTGMRAFEDVLLSRKFMELGGNIIQKSNVAVSHINYTEFKKIKQSIRMVGKYSAIVRKQQGFPPKIIFQYPILAFSLAGFRYFSILSRVIATKNIFPFLLYNPIIIYLLIQWSIGFYKGAKQA